MDSCLPGGTLLRLEIFVMVSSLLHGVLATVTTVVSAALETQSHGDRVDLVSEVTIGLGRSPAAPGWK
jgi:hypothetical protein